MVKIDDNLDFCQHFRKISILVVIYGMIELGQNFPQILVLVKISEKVDFGQNLEICRSWLKFIKISKLVKILKNNDLVKIVGNSRFYQYVDFWQNCI